MTVTRRQTVTEQFSTFIRWREHRFNGWQVHSPLLRQMKSLLAEDPSLTTSPYWVIYWYQQWLAQFQGTQQEDQGAMAVAFYPQGQGQSETMASQSDPILTTALGQDALCAYLQECCYQAAGKLYRDYQARCHHQLDDYFGLGMVNADKVLKEFNPQLSPNLEAYAYPRFKWRMLDELRRWDRTFGYTSWSLLLDTSETRFRKALQRAGLGTAADNHFEAWLSYKAIYQTAKIIRDSRVQEPTPEAWAAIQQAYQRQTMNSATPQQLRQWLIEGGTALMNYLSPSTTSIDHVTNPLGPDGSDDLLSEDDDEPSWDSYEGPAQYQRILTWLETELTAIAPQHYRLNSGVLTMIELYYGQGLKQVSIAHKLEINQSTVARNLSKFLEILAMRFIQWAEEAFPNTVSPEQIPAVCTALEQWLHHYYQVKLSRG
jgi:RNA polymerase sigma factor (sigma-70 family)